MAEAAILLALQKTGSFLAGQAGSVVVDLVKTKVKEEALKLQKLPHSAERIQNELSMINQFVKKIGTRYQNDELLEEWLGQVRTLAYQVEDVMDDYSYHVAQLQGEGRMGKVRKGSKYLIHFVGIADQLTQIEEKIKEVKKLKAEWVQPANNLAVPREDTEILRSQSCSAQLVQEVDLVGIENNRMLLTDWLNSKEQGNSIIAVWGLGGLGKTTLVANVYEREKQNFHCRAWVSVSQSYNIEHILRLLIRKLSREGNPVEGNIDSMDRFDLKETLRKVLQFKKYFVVLDDIWEQRAFDEIRDAFVDDQAGSRIVITTRKGDVASLAHTSRQLEIKPLDSSEAFQLFCKRAFQENLCPPRLQDLATKIVKRCQGLPLAIVSIGSLLSSRRQIESVWKQMYDQLQWELQNNRELDHVRGILNLSYNNLPGELKACFLYCSLFPEDHVLSREMLVRLWIAEAFVTEKGESTLEEVAEGYLSDLIRWSMLEPVEHDELGKVSTCKMHDIVRDLALSISKAEKFGVTNQSDRMTIKDPGVRRVSICKWSEDIAKSMNFPHLRTLIATDTAAPPPSLLSSVSSTSRYISVLELQGSLLHEVPKDIGHLFNLHYLGLRYTKVKSLPKSIENLTNLQTLDLRATEIEALPNEIAKLRKLRHLFADKYVDQTRGQFRYFRGVSVPKGFSNLDKLQTLEAIEACKDLADHLEHLTDLRSLWIDNVTNAYCEKLFASLSKMRYLTSLLINASDEKELLCLKTLNPERMELQKLVIRGSLAQGTLESPIFKDHGTTLKYLALSWCGGLGEDPLGSLSSHLPNLTILSLNRMHCAEELVLHDECFPQLKSLTLKNMSDVERLTFKRGSVKKLESLYIFTLPQLKDVPEGVEDIASLKKLWLVGLHENFKSDWQKNNWQQKLQRIPELHI